MPEQVGPYTIVGELGRGGMAVVYLARQPALGRSVALKELAPFQAHDPLLAQRFIREARVAARLNHPNVVTVYDFLEQDGVAYIAMEYVDRGSLREQVGQLSLPQVAGVLEGLLAGLSHAESIGVAHRDIKPENLLVTADGGIKIADFGIAKAYQQVATEEMLTPAGATVGTPAYMAPEQAMGQEIGPWTDLYQTGVVAYELLGSGVPFRSTGNPLAVMMMHISEPVPALPEGTDPALEQWVRALLSKDPADRPASARAAFNEFEEIVVATLGPLWRRDARLGDRDPTVEHALTPASFSTWEDYVPGTPGRAAPPPPPPARERPPQAPTLAPAAPAEPPRPAPPPATPVPPVTPPPADTAPPVSPPPADTVPPVTPPPAATVPPVTPPPAATVPPVTPPPAATVPPVSPPPADTTPPVTPPPAATVPPVAPGASEPPPAPPAATVPPVSPPGGESPAARGSRRPFVLVAGLLALVVVALVVFLLTRGGGEPPAPTPTATATATATPSATATAAIAAGPFAIGDGPDGIAVGAGAVWAAASRDGTLTRIDPVTGETATVKVGKNPDSVVVAFDEVWVSLTDENKVARVSTDAKPRLLGTVDVGAQPEGIAASGRALWVANSGDGSVTQIIAATRETQTVTGLGGEPHDVAVGAGAVWVANAANGTVARVDGGRHALVKRVGGLGPNPRALVIVGRDVWVATAGDGRVWRIDGDASAVEGSVEVGGTPRDVATDGAHLWVTDRNGDRVIEVDAKTRKVVKSDDVPGGPLEVAVDANSVYATGFDSGEVSRLER